jgi:hypothetical protein
VLRNYYTPLAAFSRPLARERDQRFRPRGEKSIVYEDLRIRELGRLTNEWTPPIGAMGGPPAHELYKDLVLFAGFQLFRDAKSRPWVVLRDGAQRRAFPVPSPELRAALDRFRMRRNLRPVPESDIDDFVRVIEARITDPDVEIPLLASPVIDRWSPIEPTFPTVPRPPNPTSPPKSGIERWLAPTFQDSNAVPRYPIPEGAPPELSRPTEFDPPTVGRPPPRLRGIDTSVSGGRVFPPPSSPVVARYVRVLRDLVRNGAWMGSIGELSALTHDDPYTVFDTLVKYRVELARNDILVANVEVGEGYRWLAVDRTRTRGSGPDGAPDGVSDAGA